MVLGLKSEVIKTLSLILPALSEIYGSHWEECMDILNSVLQKTGGGEEGIPLLVSSFKLFSQLKSLSESDSNEDVQDAWAARKADLFTALASTVDTFGKPFRLPPTNYMSNQSQIPQPHSTNLAILPSIIYDA
jgi:hypothetical protein